MGRRLADEQEMPARRPRRLADRLAGVEIVAEIRAAMLSQSCFVVPILRHDKLRLQRARPGYGPAPPASRPPAYEKYSVVPPLRLRDEQFGQCSFAER
jgi:hypothetical protein